MPNDLQEARDDVAASRASDGYPLVAMPLWVGMAEAITYSRKLERPRRDPRCPVCGASVRAPSRGEYFQCAECGNFW